MSVKLRRSQLNSGAPLLIGIVSHVTVDLCLVGLEEAIVYLLWVIFVKINSR